MLKCRHIICLDCIIQENMTYSECKICSGIANRSIGEQGQGFNLIDTFSKVGSEFESCDSVKVISTDKINHLNFRLDLTKENTINEDQDDQFIDLCYVKNSK